MSSIAIFLSFCLEYGPLEIIFASSISIQIYMDSLYITIIRKSIFLIETSLIHLIWKCS